MQDDDSIQHDKMDTTLCLGTKKKKGNRPMTSEPLPFFSIALFTILPFPWHTLSLDHLFLPNSLYFVHSQGLKRDASQIIPADMDNLQYHHDMHIQYTI